MEGENYFRSLVSSGAMLSGYVPLNPEMLTAYSDVCRVSTQLLEFSMQHPPNENPQMIPRPFLQTCVTRETARSVAELIRVI